MKYTSSTVYLFKGFYDWLLENNLTPHVIIDTTVEGVEVPEGYKKNKHLVLNISPSATDLLIVDEKGLSFNARFNGVSNYVFIPLDAIKVLDTPNCIYRMEFNDNFIIATTVMKDDLKTEDVKESKKESKSFLKVVK